MTLKDYPIYKDRVLAKCDGANVHKVNGLLGIVINSLDNREYWEKQDDSKRAKAKEYISQASIRIHDSLKQIKKLTGVSV